MIFATETWDKVEEEFDDLGRKNFEECGIGGGKYEYNLHHGMIKGMESTGNLHLVTARVKGKLVGYVLSIISHRHLMYEACVSQQIGMYLLPEHRKGLNGLKMMEFNEKSLKKLGVEEMNGGFTISKSLLTLFERQGWTPAESAMRKFLW